MNPFRLSASARLLAMAGLLAAVAIVPAHATDFYLQHNLVSDGAIAADNKDPNLVNAWGIAFNPFGPVWVADNGSGKSTLYNGAGTPQPMNRPLIVNIPPPAAMGGSGTPTGIVFNGSSGFQVGSGINAAPSRFIFATEDGVIAGWSPTVDPLNAIRMVDNSGSVYKALALGAGGQGALLFAADFRNARIDVFDAAFKPVTVPPGAFTDRALPAGFAPFGLQVINGDLYVSYAKQDAGKKDDVHGAGLGYVDVYTPAGVLLQRLVAQGSLNAPWGMALAPAGFGRFGGRLLVGNFGDGMINAFNVATGAFVGRLATPDMHPIQIDGLWGLAFGNGYAGQPVDTLFFTAGPNDEKNGLYGRIDVSQAAPARSDMQGE
jgi:uncharacterized protein (TIGR03118 family)